MDEYLKRHEISLSKPEFDFITNALQTVIEQGKLKITKDGFELFLNELEKSLYHEDVSIYLENNYAQSEFLKISHWIITKSFYFPLFVIGLIMKYIMDIYLILWKN